VADGVDAAVDSVEAAGFDALSHSACCQASQLQLTKADHPVLTSRELSDTHITRGFRKKRDAYSRFFRDPLLRSARRSLHRCR
jgi:hypothetical protein